MKLKTLDKLTVAGCYLLIVIGLGAIAFSVILGIQQVALTAREGTGMELVAVVAIAVIIFAAGAAALWFAVWAFRDRARDRRREEAEAEQRGPFPV